MNSTTSSMPGDFRLKRIRIVSQIFMTLFLLSEMLMVFFLLMGIYFWLNKGAVISDGNHPFAPNHRTLENIIWLGFTITYGLGAWFCFKLFRFYSRGNLFGSENIRLIRKIAWIYFLVLIENFLFDFLKVSNFSSAEGTRWLGALLLVAPGFLILFIAWIMDEGRKIQEEQELTV